MVSKFMFLMFGLLFYASVAAQPVASNLVVAQRAGAALVDLSYDLSGAGQLGTTVVVTIGDNFGSVPRPSLSGDLGAGITSGIGKQIVWDAGVDKPDFRGNVQFELKLYETFIPPEDQFVLIPEGSFTFGGYTGVGEHYYPERTVNLPGFYMSKYQVTWRQWKDIIFWADSNGYANLNSGYHSVSYASPAIPPHPNVSDDHPVNYHTWFDVVAWCNAASEKAGLEPVYYLDGEVYRGSVHDGSSTFPYTRYPSRSSIYIDYTKQGYRLPTEEEWEKAARGGKTGLIYGWIEFRPPDYIGNLNNTNNFTTPVGSYNPNPYGLYDMLGNVRDWTNDTHEFDRVVVRGSDYTIRALGVAHRGNYRARGWYVSVSDLRTHLYGTLGFRLVMSEVVP
jgi:formylglycine-generating enzyme required for sulfatase activity